MIWKHCKTTMFFAYWSGQRFNASTPTQLKNIHWEQRPRNLKIFHRSKPIRQFTVSILPPCPRKGKSHTHTYSGCTTSTTMQTMSAYSAVAGNPTWCAIATQIQELHTLPKYHRDITAGLILTPELGNLSFPAWSWGRRSGRWQQNLPLDQPLAAV